VHDVTSLPHSFALRAADSIGRNQASSYNIDSAFPWYYLSMKRGNQTPSQWKPSSRRGKASRSCAMHELELSAAGLSDVERQAISQGIDAAKIGSFAPQEEVDEFYRLHRDS
jgi:hypothetical protein